MSLFLKNLPQSFYRAIISSRPIFDKAKSLFSSISANAQLETKFPVYSVGRNYARTIYYTSNEDKSKHFARKYTIYHHRPYSKKSKKSTKSSAKPPKLKAPKISSPGVDCTVEKSLIECSIDCEKLPGAKKNGSSKSITSCSQRESAKKEVPPPKKKIIPKHKKEEKQSSRCDVKALTGTWVSKKCIKFNFSAKQSCGKRDEETKPVKLEDEGKKSKALKCKTSKDLAKKVHKEKKSTSCQKSSQTSLQSKTKKDNESVCKKESKEETKPCSKAVEKCPSEIKKKESKTTCPKIVEEEKKKSKSTCKSSEKIKQDQAPLMQCVDKCKKSGSSKRETKSKPVTKKCKTKKTAKKNTKGKKTGKTDKCKPCTSKKQTKKPTKKESKEQAKTETDKEKRSEPKISEAANTSLVTKPIEEDNKNMARKSIELIDKLKKELEECRRSKSQSQVSESKNLCVEPPKLDGKLPKPKEQEKDVISGSKNFVKSVRDGFFGNKNKKTPGKTESAPVVKTGKPGGKPVQKSKSADCKIDLNPKYCEKTADKKKDDKKKKDKVTPCKDESQSKSAKDTCAQKESAKKTSKTSSPCLTDRIKPGDLKKKSSTCSAKKKKSDMKTTSSEKIKKKESTCGSKKKDSEMKTTCSKDKLKSEETKKKESTCGSEKKESETKSTCPSKKPSKPKPPCNYSEIKPKNQESKDKGSACGKSVSKSATKNTKIEEKKSTCGPKEKKSETKSPCPKLVETKNEKPDSCGDAKKKEVIPCKDEDKKKDLGPPDQSPIMQCIALCRKKKKANTPQKGKGVPPRDKKECTKDKEIFKKLVEYDEKKKSEDKPKCDKKKEKIKKFVPCKYEEIKPGIRKSDDSECDGQIYKKFECEDSDKQIEQGEKKSKTRCEQLGEKQDKDSVQISDKCQKFRNPCPECQKPEEDNCDQKSKSDDCK